MSQKEKERWERLCELSDDVLCCPGLAKSLLLQPSALEKRSLQELKSIVRTIRSNLDPVGHMSSSGRKSDIARRISSYASGLQSSNGNKRKVPPSVPPSPHYTYSPPPYHVPKQPKYAKANAYSAPYGHSSGFNAPGIPPAHQSSALYPYPSTLHSSSSSSSMPPHSSTDDYGRDVAFQNVLLESLSANEQRSNDEAKEEPNTWEKLQPVSELERMHVQSLARLGFSNHKALETLRKCQGDVGRATSMLYEELRDLQEANIMDKVALESESTARTDKKRAREEEEKLLSYSDVLSAGIFERSIFLDTNFGVERIRDILTIERDGVCDLSETDLREICLKLLKLEMSSIKWYGLQACPYMYGMTVRLNANFSEALLEKEVATLEKILYCMPERAGDVPKDFLDALEQHPLSKLKSLSGSSIVALSKTLPQAIDDDSVQILPNAPKTSPSLGNSSTKTLDADSDLIDLT